MYWDIFEKLCCDVGKKPNPVGKEIGVSSSTISQWKNGSIPNGETLMKIADYLNVSVDYLLGRTDSSNNNNIINTGDINGNHNANIGVVEHDKETEKEISSIISGMSYREKTELMTLIYKFADEHKKED
jgi:transcriptional regulator with XRE-family HTH domain